MKNPIATSIDQSKHLIECGVDPRKGDFVWIDDKPDEPRLTIKTDIIEEGNPYVITRAFSLSALLSIIPDTLKINGKVYGLSLNYDPTGPGIWTIGYGSCKDSKLSFGAKTLFEGCVNLIDKLILLKLI